jgi:hypothetical protein
VLGPVKGLIGRFVLFDPSSVDLFVSDLLTQGRGDIRNPEFKWSRYDIESFNVRLHTSHYPSVLNHEQSRRRLT